MELTEKPSKQPKKLVVMENTSSILQHFLIEKKLQIATCSSRELAHVQIH